MASKGRKGRGGKGKTPEPDRGFWVLIAAQHTRHLEQQELWRLRLGRAGQIRWKRVRPCMNVTDPLRRLFFPLLPLQHSALTLTTIRSQEGRPSLLTLPTCPTMWTKVKCKRSSREPD